MEARLNALFKKEEEYSIQEKYFLFSILSYLNKPGQTTYISPQKQLVGY